MFGFHCALPQRYVLVVIMHVSLAILHTQRINLSVAIVMMVNGTFANVQQPSSDPECQRNNLNISTLNTTFTVRDKEGDLNWDQKQQVNIFFINNSNFHFSLEMLKN